MPNIDKHAPGTFAWAELGTTDQAAAKQFYTGLFGWQYEDHDMGPAGTYSTVKANGRDIAGCYKLDSKMLEMGIPPHWMLYVGVASADEMAAKAKEAGGTVLQGPFDVMTLGRMAVIKDPTGAVFSIWEPKMHQGIGLAGEPGTLCWADLNTHKPDEAKAFYSKVFGWEISLGENDKSGYLHIKNGQEFIGGIPPMKNAPASMPAHWLQYYLVTDIDASTGKAKELGGRVWMGPMDIENVGKMTVLADPQGAALALFQPNPRQ
ncbi:MAG TPA: VOC family protein [Candidatus Limnocylindrales bacterium]|nr:VOC family protein [Candidatus Limnocylindrales bacterium]